MACTVGLIMQADEKLICPTCGKAYKSAEGLKRHIEKDHTV